MTDDAKTDLKEQVDEWENNLRRIIVNEGVDLQALEQQVSDPHNHVDVQLQMISAVTGIPKRILTGSERGELSSGQDANEWKTFVQARREDHAEPDIIRPLIDRLIELGILPTPKVTYKLKWLDLFSVSEKERVEIGKGRANALREYTSNPMAEAIIPPKAFMKEFLGFSADQIEQINKIRDEGLSDEEKELMEEIRELVNPTPVKEEPVKKETDND